MPFELKITGANAAELAQSLVSAAFTMSPELRDRLAPHTAPAAPVAAPAKVEETVAETVEEPKKPSTRRKKAETIEHKEDENVHSSGDAAVAADAAAGDAGSTEDAPAEPASAGAEAANDDSAEDVDLKDVPTDVDGLRLWAIREYLNKFFEEQADKTAEFRSILDTLSVGRLNELPADRLPEFAREVARRIKAKSK